MTWPVAAERGVFLNSRERPDGRFEWRHHFAHLAARAAAAPPGSGDGDRDAVSSVLAASGWEDLAAVRVPVTLVRGTRGYVTPADAADFTRRLPAASVIELDSGHNVHEEQPRGLAELIRARAGND